MMGWGLVLLACLYLCLLFALAWWGDGPGRDWVKGNRRALVYALALAVYCTSWTFYGSVGSATRSGWDFLAIYLGPILAIGPGIALVMRIVKIAKAQNSTSIADFLASRYGKSERVAAIVTLIAVTGCIPYIALQLKAISVSLETILAIQDVPLLAATPFGDIALWGAFVLALFAMAFGTRNVDATENHDGMTLAIALESLLKLLVFLIVGSFVVFWLRGGMIGAIGIVPLREIVQRLTAQTSSLPGFFTLTLLSAIAILALPRQFHVTVVENRAIEDVRKASWLFPLYLVLINLFVLPLAIAAIVFLPPDANRDMAVLLLPLREGANTIAMLAFLGGFSAATAMVIVELVALAIMISNHWVIPVLMRFRGFNTPRYQPMGYADLSALVRNVRRIAICVLVVLAYFYARYSADAILASTGLLAFAAIAQLAPVLIGGLFWKRGTALGAGGGLMAGFILWSFTLLLPALLGADHPLVANGLYNISFLRPDSLFGLEAAPLTHGVFWSLLLNIICYVVFSLLHPPSALEKIQADAFVGTEEKEGLNPSFRLWRTPVMIEEVQATVARYLGEERTARSFTAFLQDHPSLTLKSEADAATLRFAEHLLSAAIGAASSRLALSLLLTQRNVSTKAALQLLDDASAAMQYNRDLLQHALDHASQGITVLDRDLKILCWNHAFIDLYELPPNMMRDGIGLDDIVRFNAQRGLYGPGMVDELVTARLYSLSHLTKPVKLTLHPSQRVIEIRSNHLPGGGLVTTYTDITERVADEAAREKATEILEQTVAERTREANQAKAIAEEANASKTRFLAAASHDILQPLNAARLYAAALNERELPESENVLAKNVDASLDAVEEILNALLEISRLDTGSLRPDWTIIRLNDLFEQLQREFEPVAAKKNLKLTFVSTSLAVRSDKRMLRRLVQNLVSNAIKYTLSGHVLIGVRRRKGRVRVEVHDTGQGVPKEQHQLIFQEFKRLDQGARVAPGLGLGLSIVDRIARVLGHELHLDSESGKGSVFSIDIPGAPSLPEGESAEPAPAPVFQPLGGMKVMAIDNEPDILNGMQILLSGWGCEVLTATDPREALAQAKQRNFVPDILIADYHLDDGNGLDAIATIRWQVRHDIPAVLVTADRSDAVRDETQRRNVRLLNKPLRPAALRSLLGQWRTSIGLMQDTPIK
jgi:Na+/proline symporter/signal transduction histidine kinase